MEAWYLAQYRHEKAMEEKKRLEEEERKREEAENAED